jgi:ribosomal-protein-alanine N-acetyltransferase
MTQYRQTFLSCLVRRVDASDAAGIHAIEKACFPDPYPLALLENLTRTEQNHFFVAVDEGKIIGYAVASMNDKEGHIISIAVDPRRRRRGIGRALLSTVTTKLSQEGVEQIHLEVRKGNIAAISFYERNGYRPSLEIPHYYPDGEDAWVLKSSTKSPSLANH